MFPIDNDFVDSLFSLELEACKLEPSLIVI